MKPSPFPPSIHRYLRAFVARRRFVGLLRAIGFTLAVAITWLLASCLIDRAINLLAIVRAILLIVGISLTIGTLVWAVTRAMRSASWQTVAAQIESRTDRFGQRLQTAISQLLAKDDYRGSEPMLASIIAEVESLCAGQRAARLIPWRLALLPWAATSIAMVAFAMLWPFTSLGMPRLVTRAFHPERKIDPVTITVVDLLPKGTDVYQGGSVSIEATVSASKTSSGTRGAELYLSSDSRTWSHVAMTAAATAPDHFTFPLPAIDRDLHYYVRAGDATTETYEIRVKRVPAVTEFHIRYSFPPYTGRPPLTITNTDGLIESLAGCDATVTLIATEPLKSAELAVGQDRYPMWSSGRATEWEANISLLKSANCAISMVSAAGVPGNGPSPMLLRALADRPPTVVIQQPADDQRLSAADAVVLKYGVIDDFGLTALSAAVRINSRAAVVFPVAIPPRALRHEGDFAFDLSDFDPKVGDVVTVTLRAEDSAGHVQTGEPRRVLIAPASIGPRAYSRAAELRRCATLATAWVDALGKATSALDAARRADPRTARQEVWGKANLAFTATAEAAAALRQSLLRAIVRSDSRGLSTALANLVDDTTGSLIEPGRVLSAAARGDDALVGRLNSIAGRARDAVTKINVLAQGEQSALVLAEQADLKAVVAAPPLDAASNDLRAKAIDRARQKIEGTLRALQLSGDAAALDGPLHQRVQRAADFIGGQHPLDVVAAAHEWVDRLRQSMGTTGEFAARLGAAAQAEVLRVDADLILSRDLQIASRAAGLLSQSVVALRESEHGKPRAEARAKLTETLQQFETALAVLARDREHPISGEAHNRVADARRRLLALAGESNLPESMDELAFEAGAASAWRDDARVGAIDAKLAEEIGRSSQEESTRFADDVAHRMNQAAAILRLIARQEELRHGVEKGLVTGQSPLQRELAAAMEEASRLGDSAGPATQPATQPAADLPDTVDLTHTAPPAADLVARSPLIAAAWHARVAAQMLARPEGDPRVSLTRQQDAITLLRAGWSAALHQAALRRLEESPALSPLFQPYALEEGGPGSLFAGALPRIGLRVHEMMLPGTVNTGGREADPAGYQDQLKAYFDALTKTQGKK